MLDRTKLAKVLGRLGSDYNGERENAFAHATKMVKDAGLTWDQVLDLTGSLRAAREATRKAEESRDAALAELEALRRQKPSTKPQEPPQGRCDDPWDAKLRTYLRRLHGDRFTTFECLEMIGVPYRQQSVIHQRRLARLMRNIGGWHNSPNVCTSGGMRRGWIKDDSY